VNFDATGQTDHIFCICQILEKKYDYNEAVHQLFIDFKKVNVSGIAKNLIKSYLYDRFQRVKIKNYHLKNHFSEWKKVKQGVPQGSVFAPHFLFFLLMICQV
jgi:hypothetical protein